MPGMPGAPSQPDVGVLACVLLIAHSRLYLTTKRSTPSSSRSQTPRAHGERAGLGRLPASVTPSASRTLGALPAPPDLYATPSTTSHGETPPETPVGSFVAGGEDDAWIGAVAGEPLPPLLDVPRAPIGSETIASAPTAEDWGPAPRGPSKNGWPLKYVVDMAHGFAALQKIHTSPKMIEIDFAVAFPGFKYVRATYSDNWAAWRAAGEVPGEQARWIAHGRSDQGTWSAFTKQWKKRRAH